MGFDLGMNNVAFDLDGVFIPDCDKIPIIGGVEDFLNLTVFMRPLFQPTGNWSIITGRDQLHSEITKLWVNKHFVNAPQKIWHCNQNHAEPWIYKATVINENGIDTYVESDWHTVQYLRNNTNCAVLHFGDFIANKLLTNH